MTSIYLDVNDRVRIDKTPDGELSRKAAIDRAMLKMGALQERLALLVIRHRESLGYGAWNARACLGQVRELCREIREGPL